METQKFIELIVREQILFIQAILPKRKILCTTGIHDVNIFMTFNDKVNLNSYHHQYLFNLTQRTSKKITNILVMSKTYYNSIILFAHIFHIFFI